VFFDRLPRCVCLQLVNTASVDPTTGNQETATAESSVQVTVGGCTAQLQGSTDVQVGLAGEEAWQGRRGCLGGAGWNVFGQAKDCHQGQHQTFVQAMIYSDGLS
jgi:hypothetical protein